VYVAAKVVARRIPPIRFFVFTFMCDCPLVKVMKSLLRIIAVIISRYEQDLLPSGVISSTYFKNQ
jgi:hypothetical protein